MNRLIQLPKLRLSHQLLGFFVLVVLIPLLFLTYSIYSINQTALKKQVAKFTKHAAESTQRELLLEMNWQKEQARMASEYWVSIINETNPELRKKRLTRFFNNYRGFEAVSVYDKSGKRTAFVLSPYSKYERIDLPETLPSSDRQITLKMGYHASVQKTPDMAYSLQIMVPQSQFGKDPHIGAIGFYKRFPYMGRLVAEKFDNFHNGFVIVDKHGIIIAGPPKLLSKTIPKEDLERFSQLPAGLAKEFSTDESSYNVGASHFNTADYQENEPSLQKVLIKIPKLSWGIIIESPYRVQTRYILRARTQSAALVGLCILLIIVLGMFYSRGINRNFRQLIKGIKALAEGRYSRKIRLITKYWTPYEIVYLTAEFNRMATKISSAWASIQKLNQELVNKNQQDLFIARATQRLHSSLELQTVCETAVALMTERADILGAMLYLQTEPEHFTLAAQSARSLLSNIDANSLSPGLFSFFHKVLKTMSPLQLAQEVVLPEDTVASLHPISYQENPQGVLVLIKTVKSNKEMIKLPQDIETPIPRFDNALVIEMIAAQIGIAIHQARQWQQLQDANKQLARLDELKSNLIDTVSHELRTPLTSIKGYTSRLIRNEGSLDPETRIKSLKVVKQQADRLGRLVEDLLVIPDLEREEGIRVFPDRVNLRRLLNQSLALILEKSRRDHPRNIELTLPEEDMDLLVDPDRMEQVMLNLLDNAIKYALEGATIQVFARKVSDATVQIQVYNPCLPIPQEDLATLFTKFKRLDERLTRTTRGTGLGLFITKGLVEAMGGNIRLEGHDGFRVLLDIPLFHSAVPSENLVAP